MLSNRAKNIHTSVTLALMAKEKELKAQGKDVISLAVGEPDWDTAEHVKKAAISAIQEGFTKYTPVSGIPELKKALISRKRENFNINFDQSQVTVGAGAKFLIFTILEVLCNPGEEVLIPAPYWVSYPEMVELVGLKPVIVPCRKETNFKLSPSALEEKITARTTLMILNSPSNPTGEVYSYQELEDIAKILERHPHVYVLSDDIYNQLVFDYDGVAPHLLEVAPQLKDRVIMVNGASKSYAMTGWRIGWALGPKEIIKSMSDCQSQSIGSVCSISQRAALEAIQNGEQDIKDSVRRLKERRDFALQRLAEIPGIISNRPQGAFYLWVDISALIGKTIEGMHIENSKQFCALLLDKENVALVPGIEFGLEGYFRMSYVLEQKRMNEAISRIARFVSLVK